MKFFNSNSLGYRLLRTIVQGVIGAVIANLDLLIGSISINEAWKPFIVVIIMAILSPIMSEMGGKNE